MLARPANVPAMFALSQWGDKWAVDKPALTRWHSSGERLQVDLLCHHCGRAVTRDNIHAEPTAPNPAASSLYLCSKWRSEPMKWFELLECQLRNLKNWRSEIISDSLEKMSFDVFKQAANDALMATVAIAILHEIARNDHTGRGKHTPDIGDVGFAEHKVSEAAAMWRQIPLDERPPDLRSFDEALKQRGLAYEDAAQVVALAAGYQDLQAIGGRSVNEPLLGQRPSGRLMAKAFDTVIEGLRGVFVADLEVGRLEENPKADAALYAMLSGGRSLAN